MRIYAESSAVLAWVLREPDGPKVDQVLYATAGVVSSALTVIECDRALIRAGALKRIIGAEIFERHIEIENRMASWDILPLDEEIVARARQPFPMEPIRTLDAIHLACVLTARAAVPDLALLSLDERVRAAARGLDIPLLPA